MLVLSRKAGEEITVGLSVRIRVLQVRGHRVRIGVTAPQSISVHRGETQTSILREISVAGVTDVPNSNCSNCSGS